MPVDPDQPRVWEGHGGPSGFRGIKPTGVYELETIGISVSLDVQVGATPFHSSVLERARPMSLGPGQVRFPTVEDLILLKLLAFRPVDRADCIHLSLVHTDLDLDYLGRWLQDLGLEPRWLEVLEAARTLDG